MVNNRLAGSMGLPGVLGFRGGGELLLEERFIIGISGEETLK